MLQQVVSINTAWLYSVNWLNVHESWCYQDVVYAEHCILKCYVV